MATFGICNVLAEAELVTVCSGVDVGGEHLLGGKRKKIKNRRAARPSRAEASAAAAPARASAAGSDARMDR